MIIIIIILMCLLTIIIIYQLQILTHFFKIYKNIITFLQFYNLYLASIKKHLFIIYIYPIYNYNNITSSTYKIKY